MAEDERLPRAGADEVADGGDERGLARAVRAEQAEELAVADREVEGVEREQRRGAVAARPALVVVALGQTAQLERRRAGGIPSGIANGAVIERGHPDHVTHATIHRTRQAADIWRSGGAAPGYAARRSDAVVTALDGVDVLMRGCRP